LSWINGSKSPSQSANLSVQFFSPALKVLRIRLLMISARGFEFEVLVLLGDQGYFRQFVEMKAVGVE
jgi:hypothetical protein